MAIIGIPCRDSTHCRFCGGRSKVRLLIAQISLSTRSIMLFQRQNASLHDKLKDWIKTSCHGNSSGQYLRASGHRRPPPHEHVIPQRIPVIIVTPKLEAERISATLLEPMDSLSATHYRSLEYPQSVKPQRCNYPKQRGPPISATGNISGLIRTR